MFLCSCEHCQKVSGGGHSSVVLLPSDAVTIDGATQSYARAAASGAVFTRQFCPECGTTICAFSSRAPALRIVPAGLFAGHNEWFAPNQLIFARSHPDWDHIPEGLTRHDTYREEESR